MFSIALEHDKFSLGGFGPSLADKTFWVVLIYGVFINLNNFGIDQGYAQRYVAARSDAEAAKSLWLGGLLYVPLSVVFFFIGTALFAFYEVFPERLPADLVGDRVFPYFIVNELPTGVTGLLIAAIFAAAMSTISTNINSGSTIFMTDVYKRYLRPNATDKQMMRALYGSTLVIGATGIGIALLLIQAQGILDAWWKMQGIFAGGMLGLFLLGMVSRRAGNVAAAIGVIVGVLLIAWMTLSPLAESLPTALKNPLHSYMTVVIGTSTIVLVGMLVAQFAPRPQSPDVS
jgi:SSS family solute:Na+ symporter